MRYQSVWFKKRLNKRTAEWRWRLFIPLFWHQTYGWHAGVGGCHRGSECHWAWGINGDPLTTRQEGPIPLTSPYSVCRTLVAQGKETVGRQPVFGEQETPGKVLSEEWKLPRSMLGSSRTLKALVTCVSWSKVNEHLFFSPSLPGLKLCYQTAVEESSRKLKRMTLYSLHIKVAVLVWLSTSVLITGGAKNELPSPHPKWVNHTENRHSQVNCKDSCHMYGRNSSPL